VPYLVIVLRMELPFALHDDAYWLLPSLLHDGALPLAEQLRRDVGERGAHSLNAYLRTILFLEGLNPRHHALTGIALHLLCCWLFFLVLAQRGFDRATALVASLVLLGASQAFHAWVWVIAHQHLLSLAFIFMAVSITYRMKQKLTDGFDTNRERAAWCLGVLAFLLLASLNRLSSMFVTVAWWLSFARIAQAIPRRERFAAAGLFVVGLAVLWLYPAHQLVSGQEGWQVTQFANRLLRLAPGWSGTPSAAQLIALVVFASVASLGAWLCIPFERAPGRIPGRSPMQWVCFLLALLLAFLVFHPERFRLGAVPSVLANLVALPPEALLEQRWFPIGSSVKASIPASAALCVVFLGGLAYLLRRAPEQARSLCALLLAMAIVTLLYFETLAQAPLSLRDLPSRYAAYLLPLVSLVVAVALVDGARAALPRSGPALPAVAALAFLVGGHLQFHARLDHMLRYDLQGLESRDWPVTKIVATIERHASPTGAGTVRYLRASVPLETFHPFIAAFIPPANSPDYPRIANLQAMLQQRPGTRGVTLAPTDDPDSALRFSAPAD